MSEKPCPARDWPFPALYIHFRREHATLTGMHSLFTRQCMRMRRMSGAVYRTLSASVRVEVMLKRY